MKCFYHNDLDGRCAGSIVAKYENNYNPKDFYEVDYVIDLKPLIDNIEDNEKVYFVDYSFTKANKWVLDCLLEKGCNIIWCDHHQSSMELIKNFPELVSINGIRCTKFSGAVLTYMYLYDIIYKKIPDYIRYVGDYDCWTYKYGDNTTYFKLGMDTINHDALDSIWLELVDISDLLEVIDKGKLIKKYIDIDNAEYLNEYGYESEIEGYKCYVVNRKTNSWIFGEKYYKYPLVVVWAYNGENYSYSLYSSNKEVDCSKIAEKYGGGGHKGAAGFSCDRLIVK